MKFAMKFAAAAVAIFAASGAFAQKGETVKLVRIDPLTGLLGPVGVSQLKGYQFFAEKYSGKGNPAGVNFEVIGMDNKLSPTESLNALKAAIDYHQPDLAAYLQQHRRAAMTRSPALVILLRPSDCIAIKNMF